MNLFKILLLLLFTVPLYGQRAKIYAVHDGDSYKVLIEGKTEKQWIRIQGIDCPEVRSNIITKTQPYGRIVADSVRLMLKGKTVTIDSMYTDIYNRMIAKVYLDTTDVAKVIVSKGWAFVDVNNKGYEKYYNELEKLKQIAENNKTGIWFSGEVVHPITWRSIYKNGKSL